MSNEVQGLSEVLPLPGWSELIEGDVLRWLDDCVGEPFRNAKLDGRLAYAATLGIYNLAAASGEDYANLLQEVGELLEEIRGGQPRGYKWRRYKG